MTTIALANLDIVALAIGIWIALAFLTAPVVGRFLRNRPDFDPQGREPSPFYDFIAERRAAEARTMAHVRRVQDERAANLGKAA